MCVWNHVRCRWITWYPLNGASRAFRLYPFKAVKIVQILRGERDWIGRPRTFKAAGNRIFRMAFAAFVGPA